MMISDKVVITRNDLISLIMTSDKMIVLMYKNDGTTYVGIDRKIECNEIDYMIDALRNAIHNYLVEKGSEQMRRN